uniref:Uncharacterized protein n=1 Tax=Arundo donax TaxID=35708 RepID=A0A0A8Y9W4_ARUDO
MEPLLSPGEASSIISPPLP